MEFDSFSKEYRKIHTDSISKISGTDSDYFSEYKIEELFNHGHLYKGKWLDLGCGDGNTARFVKKYFPDCKYVGVDISEQSVNEAKLNNPEMAEDFLVYDGTHLPFENESINVVYMATVMHHIPPDNWLDILTEIKRVLSAKGTIVIFEHNPYNPITRKLVNDCIFDTDAVLLSARKMKKVLRRAGFADIRIRYTIFFPRKPLFTRMLKFESSLYFLPLGGQYYATAQRGLW